MIVLTQRLKKLRNDKNLTQKDIAENNNISLRAYRKAHYRCIKLKLKTTANLFGLEALTRITMVNTLTFSSLARNCTPLTLMVAWKCWLALRVIPKRNWTKLFTTVTRGVS